MTSFRDLVDGQCFKLGAASVLQPAGHSRAIADPGHELVRFQPGGHHQDVHVVLEDAWPVACRCRLLQKYLHPGL